MPKKGYRQTEEHKAKLRAYRHTDEAKAAMAIAKLGSNNPQWKGHQVGYQALHRWIRLERPYTHTCENCGKEDCPTEYANISGDYFRDVNDWTELCVSCHRKMDWARNPHKGFKLSPEDVEEILWLKSEGCKQKDIAAMFGVVPSMISLIVNGKRRHTSKVEN